MHPALMALFGLPVGLVLDALVERLAVPVRSSDDGEAASWPRSAAGSLTLGVEQPAIGWLRRLLVVGATVALFAAAGARYTDPGYLPIIAAYIAVLIVCSSTDLIAYRVPNAVTYPAIVLALVAGATMPQANILDALGGGLMGGVVLLIPALITGGAAMGMGDVKLATFVGLAVGFGNALPALLIMALGGGAVALVALLIGLRKRGEPMPYAPFIAGGALAAILWRGTAFVQLS